MSQKNINSTDSSSKNVEPNNIIRELQQQLQETQNLLEKQRKENLNLKEKMIFQEKLNTQLSQFHLTSFSHKKEHNSLSLQQEYELNKAQEHILMLGNMLLKNKKTISKLKRSKLKDEQLSSQIRELINEKNFLWDLVIQIHEHITQIPHKKEDSKYEKANELIDLIKNVDNNLIKKKLKP